MREHDYTDDMERAAADEGWQAMQALLDREMPRRRRRAAGWFWPAAAVVVLGSAVALMQATLLTPDTTLAGSLPIPVPAAMASVEEPGVAATPHLAPEAGPATSGAAPAPRPTAAKGGTGATPSPHRVALSGNAEALDANVPATNDTHAPPSQYAMPEGKGIPLAEVATADTYPRAAVIMSALPVLPVSEVLDMQSIPTTFETPVVRRQRLQWTATAHLLSDGTAPVNGIGVGMAVGGPLAGRLHWQAGLAYQLREWRMEGEVPTADFTSNPVAHHPPTQTVRSQFSRQELLLPVSVAYRLSPRWRVDGGVTLGYLAALGRPIGSGSYRQDMASNTQPTQNELWNNFSFDNYTVNTARYFSSSSGSTRMARLQAMPTLGLSWQASARVSVRAAWQWEALAPIKGDEVAPVRRQYVSLGMGWRLD